METRRLRAVSYHSVEDGPLKLKRTQRWAPLTSPLRGEVERSEGGGDGAKRPAAERLKGLLTPASLAATGKPVAVTPILASLDFSLRGGSESNAPSSPIVVLREHP